MDVHIACWWVRLHAWYSHACLVLPDGIDRSTGVQAKGCLMGASTKFDCPTLQGLVAGYGIDIILEYFRAFLSLATTFSSYLDHFSRISQLPATSTSINVDHFFRSALSALYPHQNPPNPTRSAVSKWRNWRLCLLDAHCCLQPNGVPDLRLLTGPGSRVFKARVLRHERVEPRGPPVDLPPQPARRRVVDRVQRRLHLFPFFLFFPPFLAIFSSLASTQHSLLQRRAHAYMCRGAWSTSRCSIPRADWRNFGVGVSKLGLQAVGGQGQARMDGCPQGTGADVLRQR